MNQTPAPAEQLPAARLVGRRGRIAIMSALIGALALMAIVAALGSAVGLDSVLAGDPSLYESRWDQIAGGLIPYVDMEFEHLPLAIVPMAAAGLLRDLTGFDYTIVYAVLTMGLVAWTSGVIRMTGRTLGQPEAPVRFVVLVAPLLPLILFRNDILPVLCTAVALSAWVRRRETTGILAIAAGVLAKGWPAVVVVTEWWRGNRARAALMAAYTAAVLGALAALPGFQSGRSFAGVHQETLSGSVVLLWRHIAGVDLGIVGRAGAIYLDVGSWAVLLNLLVGGSLALWALRGLSAAFTWHRAHAMLAALVLALILASPLLSAQFLVWPTVFLALVVRARALVVAVAASAVTTFLFGLWDYQAMWWSIALLGRNALLVALTVIAVRAASSGREQIA